MQQQKLLKFDREGLYFFLLATILRNTVTNDCIFLLFRFESAGWIMVLLAVLTIIINNIVSLYLFLSPCLSADCLNNRNWDSYQARAEVVRDNDVCLFASSGLTSV